MRRLPYKPGLGLACALLSCIGQIGAQVHANKLSVPNDPTVRDELYRAAAAMERDDMHRALTIWQAILDGGAAKVVSVHRAPRSASDVKRVVVAGDRFEGVRSHVMALIRGLPDDGIERYRELMEPRAKRLLAAALRDTDEDALRECARRFALTSSGRRAQIALTDLLLEAGRFDEARVSVQELRTAHDEADPALAVREAWALWGSHRSGELHELARAARADFSDRKIAVQGRSMAVPAFIAELASGKAQPTARSFGALQFPERRAWERAFMRNGDNDDPWDFDDTAGPDEFPVMPAVADDVVYVCDGLWLRARRVLTGGDVWSPVRSAYPEFEGRTNRALQYQVVVDDDLVFAFMSGEPLHQNYWSRRWSGLPSHKLIAVETRTGRTRWSHATFKGRTDQETEFVRKLSVNQPPVVVGDTVYAAATVLKGIFHHWLCAFERDTGRLRWKTYTGAGQTALSRGGNPRIACVPGYVTEHDGVLYYGTNMGVFCAVDAVTGSIVWQSAYAQDPLPFIDNGWGRRRYTPQPAPSWQPSRPAVHGDTVFFAPNDSYRLYAANRRTGELRTVPFASRDLGVRNRCLFGVHEGLLLVGGPGLTALDAKDFRVRWSAKGIGSRFSESKLLGRGAVLGNDIVVTTTGAAIHRFDLRTGASLERNPLRSASHAGNVVLSPRAVVIGASERVSVHVR